MNGVMMAKNGLRRKRFRAALALAGRTAADFADDMGVTAQHLGLVVRGERESARLIEEVDRFIAKHLPASGERAMPSKESAA